MKFLDRVNKHYRNIDKDDIVVYLHERSKTVSKTTLCNTRKFIKPFFNWLCENDYLMKNPFINVKPIKKDPIKKIVLNEEEI